MEMLSLISLSIFVKRRLYTNLPLEYIIILSLLPLIPEFRTYILLLLPFPIYHIRRSKEIILISLFTISSSIFLVSLTSTIFPLFPLSNRIFSLDLPKEIHIGISLFLLFLSKGRKVFPNKLLLLFPIFLLLPLLNEIGEFLSTKDLYENPIENWSYVCLEIKNARKRLIEVNGKLVYKVYICENPCVYAYVGKDSWKEGDLMCGYVEYRDGNVYLRRARVV